MMYGRKGWKPLRCRWTRGLHGWKREFDVVGDFVDPATRRRLQELLQINGRRRPSVRVLAGRGRWMRHDRKSPSCSRRGRAAGVRARRVPSGCGDPPGVRGRQRKLGDARSEAVAAREEERHVADRDMARTELQECSTKT